MLKACAICGPDSEITDSKVSAKFIDLSKVDLDDYVFEGIQICIRWYIIVLESSAINEKNENLNKGLTNVKQTSKLQEI